MTAALVAGGISGIVGLVVFLTVHHFWILPIWFIAPIGVLFAALGGMAAGWAYHELLPAFPGRPWSILVLMGLILAILAPSVILAEFRSPMFAINSAQDATLVVSTGRAVFIFVGELVLMSTLAGGLLGWLIGGTRAAAIATAIAGLAFALGPGHNIPFLSGTPATMKGIAILLLVILASAVVLVEVEWRLRGTVALSTS